MILAPIALALSVILSAYDYAYLAPYALIGIGLWCVGEQVREWVFPSR